MFSGYPTLVKVGEKKPDGKLRKRGHATPYTSIKSVRLQQNIASSGAKLSHEAI